METIRSSTVLSAVVMLSAICWFPPNKHIVLLSTRFTHLGYLPVPSMHVHLKLSCQKKAWDMAEALLYIRAESVPTWFAVWVTPLSLSASLNTNLWTVLNSMLHSYGSWNNAWSMYYVLFVFTYMESSKPLDFHFFVLFPGQIHKAGWFTHEIKRQLGKIRQWIMETDCYWEVTRPYCVSCRCRSHTLV